MKFSSIILLLTTVFLNFLIWVYINKPFHLTEGDYPINSFSFNPYKKNQSPYENYHFSKAELETDIQLLANKTRSLRLYSSQRGLDQVPQLAKKYQLKVIASAFLDENSLTNKKELEDTIRLAGKNKNVSRVILGNETQLQKRLPRNELIEYLQIARKRLKTPVSTAEPWDFWLQNPELVNEVDYIAIHILPYWNEIPIEKAVDYVFDKYELLKKTYPYKKVVIAETGWPSDGPQRGAAKASIANQAHFVRDFIRRAEEQKINYNIIEAFDQPWKSIIEGRAGEYWGILDADRQLKFELKGPVLEDPNWKYWAISSTILGLLAASFFLFRRRDLALKARIFSVIIFQLAAAAATQLAREASNEYMSPGDILFWTLMISAQTLLAIILLTDAIEIADVVGHKPLKKCYQPKLSDLKADQPFVSIHLACCKEPPEMVIATLDSLARLDYSNFEVIVVDNNTADPNLWKPVEAHCQTLGEHFRFYSLGSWPGFKAGALNFALKQTNPKTQIIGVVDADYLVESSWLKMTVPYFENTQVAVVQAPQEHRDWDHALFQKMENDEYTGFFRIGMVQRNEYNAIIQHGTMTLIRKSTLAELQGWAEWCICEDAELGLRILSQGKQILYIDHPFGRGLVPDHYEAYAKQRFRWAYGAMRILRRYWREILGIKGQLDFFQRYQFVKGWLPWMGDALHMIFTFTALIWSTKLILEPLRTDFPEPIFVYPALALVVLRICGTLWTYTIRVKIGKTRTILAMIAGGSLTHKIAKAVFQGLFTSSKPFYRTPKMDGSTPLWQSLTHVREEIILATALIVFAISILIVFGFVNDQAVIWSIALVIQSFPYFAALIASLASGLKMELNPKNTISR